MTEIQNLETLAGLDVPLSVSLEDSRRDVQADFASLDQTPAPPAPAPAPAPALLTGQTIQCGRFTLAFNFSWANVIIDQFELVPIPRAPQWLLGAVNVDGSIIPVVDLGHYLDPQAARRAIGREHRLLMGGRTSGSNENALAILFTGLPFQISYLREPLPVDQAVSERLGSLCVGMARGADGKVAFELNGDLFVQVMSLDVF